jgi:LPXTG-site transpeptidase (sortase) family protein
MKRIVLLSVVFIVVAIAIGATPAYATTPTTGPMGWLIIPSVALYAPIHTAPIVDEMHQISDHGVGHLEGTTWIDDGWGRVVLAGHNPGVFEQVLTLQVRDRIIIVSRLAAYELEVTRVITSDDDARWLYPTGKPTLTLITCEDRGNTWRIIEAMLKE